jgi:hypothetical protein
MVAITRFRYQQISIRILSLTQLYIYCGQLHVSANICTWTSDKQSVNFLLAFTFIFNRFIQFPDESPNRGRNM